MLSNGLIRLWENPEVTQLNKLPGRASFENYPTVTLAKARRRNPWKIDLDGEWDFFSAPDIVTGLGIACEASEKTQWTKITVPGHPEFQGHGKPHYTNVQMPFPEEPPRVPDHNPTGIFRRTVKIPGNWKSRRIVLHFGSAESLLAVWVNGEAVGMSKGSRLPAEFDITALACAGREMEITALVAKWSDSNFIEDQDMWWLSGLPRSVALFAMPRTHIADVNLRPVFNGKVVELEAEVRVAEFRETFDVQADCAEEELVRAARTSLALDELVSLKNLGSLAYYHMGSGCPELEDVISSVILGNSLLTARGIPVAGEYEVKNVQAMKILDTFGVGGSFTEYYAMDFADDVVLMGHDGPGHIAIASSKTKVRPLGVYHGKVGNGLSVEMSVKHGPVTLLSVVEDRDGSIFFLVAEGESVPGPILEIGNTNSRYRFPTGARAFVNSWNSHGPAHHCAVGVGHIRSKLAKLAALLNIRIETVC